jgi:tetratricopeptide (TPR) repeat protein
LLELEPNFVLAYNQLGYITMVQTRFAEAEEYFTSYRFIAPDQANPHDSLGELYIIQGRYDEAETSFETAIRIKPEFWNSYVGLANVRMLEEDFQGAAETIDRLAALEDSPEWDVDRLRCRLRFAEAEANQTWKAVLSDDAATCLEKGRADEYTVMVGHRAACQLGDWERAEAIEKRVRDYLNEAHSMGSEKSSDSAAPMLLHLEGVRLAVQGDFVEAEKRFRAADAELSFREASVGLFKLRNLTMLAETLLAKGDDAAAHQLLAKVRSVNPMVVADFEETGLNSLGLERS